MDGQVVGYVRVSSADQNPQRQFDVLGEVARVFEDRVSGKSKDRPQLAELLGYVREGDLVRVASMDRLARSLPDLLQLVSDLTMDGVSVEFIKEHVTFRPGEEDPMAMLQLQMLGAIAQFERSLILEWQREGIAAAKARGVYANRQNPVKLSPQQVGWAAERVRGGVPKSVVARELGVSRQTLRTAVQGSGAYGTDEYRAILEAHCGAGPACR